MYVTICLRCVENRVKSVGFMHTYSFGYNTTFCMGCRYTPALFAPVTGKSRDVVDKPLVLYPGVPSLIPGFSSMSDETKTWFSLHMTLA